MRLPFVPEIERGRVREGTFASLTGEPCGAFFLVCPKTKCLLKIIASNGDMDRGIPWEHVSVSVEDRVPSWKEMCWVKDMFFDAEECVVQYHPPMSKYINHHPNVLHLWRPTAQEIPMPPQECV